MNEILRQRKEALGELRKHMAILARLRKLLREQDTYEPDERLDDYGFHSFRRFRITHLEAVRAHGHLTKIWAGHSLGNDITAEYAKSLKENLN
jgi:hypothetical protein